MGELYCFAPVGMVGLLLQLLRDSKASCLCVVPDVRDSWHTTLMEGLIHHEVIASPGREGKFSKLRRNGTVVEAVFPYGMAAVLVDYRKM